MHLSWEWHTFLLVAVFFRGGVCRAVSPCFCSVAYFIMSFLPRPVRKPRPRAQRRGMPRAQRSPRSERACALGGLAPDGGDGGGGGQEVEFYLSARHAGVSTCRGRAWARGLLPLPTYPLKARLYSWGLRRAPIGEVDNWRGPARGRGGSSTRVLVDLLWTSRAR